MNWLPFETPLSLLLTAVVFFVGMLAYEKKPKPFILYVTIAFGLIGLSHLLTYVHLAKLYANLLIPLRLVAYLLVLTGIYQEYQNK